MLADSNGFVAPKLLPHLSMLFSPPPYLANSFIYKTFDSRCGLTGDDYSYTGANTLFLSLFK